MLGVLADILRRRQTEGWLVGGSVRDRELGRLSPDLDVVVAGDAAAVARELARALDAPWFVLSERHPAYRVMGRDGHVDLAAVRGAGIVDDLSYRDFTVNAMAMPVSRDGADPGDLVDPFGGLAHLREGRLVAVSERVFSDDSLRLLRAARFSHVLGFGLDQSLSQLVRSQAHQIKTAAAERVAAEMALTLAAGRAAEAARLWNGLGLLVELLPEVFTTDRLEPTIDLLERVDNFIERPAVWFPAVTDLLAERLARPVDGALSAPVALRLAGLLHRLSAEEACAAGCRLKFSGDMISLLWTVCRYFDEGFEGARRYGDPGGLGERAGGPGVAGGATVSRSDVLFLWGAAPWEPEVVLVAAAATPPSHGVASARRMMALWAERVVHGVPRPPLNGDSLMREFDLQSGPLVGKALREVRLAWEAGEASTPDEALAVARAALDLR